MITNHNRKKNRVISTLRAAAAVVAAPALLFLGAGTAHADTVYVQASPVFGGVNMSVGVGFPSGTNPHLSGCVYSATPPWGIPYLSPPFELNSTSQSFQWFVPSPETGTTWNIAVLCDGVPQTVTPSTITY